jgi:hypothetical protein
MDGVVPTDIAREKQAQLADQLLSAESALARLSHAQDDHEATLTAVLKLAEHCEKAYELSADAGKRDYNQAWFTRLMLNVDDDRPTVTDVNRTPVIEALQGQRSGGISDAISRQEKRRRALGPGGVNSVDVSNFVLLVGVTGFEPAASSSRTTRATKLRHTPRSCRSLARDLAAPRRWVRRCGPSG